MLPAFLTTILFSISAVSGNRAARLLGGTQANFWRLLFATLLLAAYAHWFGAGLSGDAFPIFLFSGVIGFGIGDAALFQALPRLGSRLSVMLVLCLSAPIAALMEWLWMGTPLSMAEMFSAMTILAGVCLALMPDAAQRSAIKASAPGIAFGVVAAFCQGYGAVLSRRAFAVAAAAMEEVDGISAAYQRILGGIGVTALFLLVVERRAIAAIWLPPEKQSAPGGSRAERWRRAWWLVLINGLAGPALGVSCYQWALKSQHSGLVLPVVALTPVVIIPFSRYLEGERPTRRSLLGGLIAVSGAVALAATNQ